MITVKEEFLSNVKTQKAIKLGGYSVLAVWLAMKAYVSETNSGGFVPAADLPALPGLPKRWDKALKALIDCGKVRPDGSVGAGLVDQVEHGYQLHDYDDHGTPVEVEDLRRQKAREQKRARRMRLRHEKGDCGPDCPHCVRGHRPDKEPDRGASLSADSDRTSPRTRAGAGARPYAGVGASQPSPAQPESIQQAAVGSETQSSTRARAREETQRQRRPQSLEQALEMPPSERAALIVANPHDGEYLQPQRWPEILAVAEALERASGRKVLPLGSYQRDGGVRAVVGLLADGFEPDELVAIAAAIPATDWWQSGKRGLSSLTPEVVRRARDAPTEAPPSDPARDAEIARKNAEMRAIDAAETARVRAELRARSKPNGGDVDEAKRRVAAALRRPPRVGGEP